MLDPSIPLQVKSGNDIGQWASLAGTAQNIQNQQAALPGIQAASNVAQATQGAQIMSAQAQAQQQAFTAQKQADIKQATADNTTINPNGSTTVDVPKIAAAITKMGYATEAQQLLASDLQNKGTAVKNASDQSNFVDGLANVTAQQAMEMEKQVPGSGVAMWNKMVTNQPSNIAALTTNNPRFQPITSIAELNAKERAQVSPAQQVANAQMQQSLDNQTKQTQSALIQSNTDPASLDPTSPVSQAARKAAQMAGVPGITANMSKSDIVRLPGGADAIAANVIPSTVRAASTANIGELQNAVNVNENGSSAAGRLVTNPQLAGMANDKWTNWLNTHQTDPDTQAVQAAVASYNSRHPGNPINPNTQSFASVKQLLDIETNGLPPAGSPPGTPPVGGMRSQIITNHGMQTSGQFSNVQTPASGPQLPAEGPGTAFPNGIPKTDSGSPDLSKMSPAQQKAMSPYLTQAAQSLQAKPGAPAPAAEAAPAGPTVTMRMPNGKVKLVPMSRYNEFVQGGATVVQGGGK